MVTAYLNLSSLIVILAKILVFKLVNCSPMTDGLFAKAPYADICLLLFAEIRFVYSCLPAAVYWVITLCTLDFKKPLFGILKIVLVNCIHANCCNLSEDSRCHANQSSVSKRLFFASVSALRKDN